MTELSNINTANGQIAELGQCLPSEPDADPFGAWSRGPDVADHR